MTTSDTQIQRVHFDYWILFSVILLIAVGIIMIFSASAVLAHERFNDGYYFLKKELLFVTLGFFSMAVLIGVPYQTWRRLVYPVLIAGLLLTALAFIPGIGAKVGGAYRWVKIMGVSAQPSEFLKLALVIFFAYSLAKKREFIKTFKIGFLPHVIFGGLAVGMVLAQRNFGDAVLIAALVGTMMVIAGVRIRFLAGALVAILPVLYLAVASVDYRRQRILAFLNPWGDPRGSGFQIIQSLVSFNEGGVLGRGLGEGQQKLFYLPAAHTDFIFSVLGEELGLIGVMVVISAFAFLVWRGLRAAILAPDHFGRYLAFGITILIGIQAILNFCVAMGLLPTKGLVLPFISYGGSALVAMLMAVGILLNVSSYRRDSSLVTRHS